MSALTRAGTGIATVLAVALLAMPGCGGGSDGGDGENLKAGLTFGLDSASVADKIAFQRAEDELGIEIELIETGDPVATLAGLERGDLDLGQFSIQGVVEAVEQGARIHAVIGSRMVADYVVVATGDIKQPADLRGARLAHHGPGTDTEALAKLTLERAGLSEDEVDLTVLPESPNRAAALANGRVDAAVLETVDLQRLERQGVQLNVLAEMRDFWPDTASGGWAVSDDLIEENPELVADLVRVMLDSYQSLYSGEGRQEWLDETGTTVLTEESEQGRKALLDHLLKIGMWPHPNQPVSAEGYDAAVRFWTQNGLLEEGLPFDRVWDTSFWQGAAD
jgi:phosphonate transport system substrate-binding protein